MIPSFFFPYKENNAGGVWGKKESKCKWWLFLIRYSKSFWVSAFLVWDRNLDLYFPCDKIKEKVEILLCNRVLLSLFAAQLLISRCVTHRTIAPPFFQTWHWIFALPWLTCLLKPVSGLDLARKKVPWCSNHRGKAAKSARKCVSSFWSLRN